MCDILVLAFPDRYDARRKLKLNNDHSVRCVSRTSASITDSSSACRIPTRLDWLKVNQFSSTSRLTSPQAPTPSVRASGRRWKRDILYRCRACSPAATTRPSCRSGGGRPRAAGSNGRVLDCTSANPTANVQPVLGADGQNGVKLRVRRFHGALASVTDSSTVPCMT